nr:hypothetical protein Iba_chr02eCG9880 [Ipomoea batatas]
MKRSLQRDSEEDDLPLERSTNKPKMGDGSCDAMESDAIPAVAEWPTRSSYGRLCEYWWGNVSVAARTEEPQQPPIPEGSVSVNNPVVHATEGDLTGEMGTELRRLRVNTQGREEVDRDKQSGVGEDCLGRQSAARKQCSRCKAEVMAFSSGVRESKRPIYAVVFGRNSQWQIKALRVPGLLLGISTRDVDCFFLMREVSHILPRLSSDHSPCFVTSGSPRVYQATRASFKVSRLACGLTSQFLTRSVSERTWRSSTSFTENIPKIAEALRDDGIQPRLVISIIGRRISLRRIGGVLQTRLAVAFHGGLG